MTATILRAGVIAGLIAGVLIDAFMIVAFAAGSREPLGPMIVSLFQFDAASAIGKATAFSSPAFAWVGAIVHFVISIAWACGFVYLARVRRELTQRPVISGLAFGLVVWMVTQAWLLAAGLFTSLSAYAVFIQLIAYCVFFGIPVAYTVSRVTR
jgi:uncharacterized membrane protein YagU involved in acid resistance